MVFYRKYRPQTIDQLDSLEIREKLFAVLSDTERFHALLFTGPKGLGKTSTARIVAKAINCEKLALGRSSLVASHKTAKDQLEPCNKCDMCVSITNGTSMDVLEIDAASNRGIDEIRDLREKARLLPSAATKKIYIIDEVHMLTTEAFNALLKTIEEPPAHVMFILCTTELHKIPATILSRCFHIMFSLATKKELVRSFQRIAKGEKIVIDDESLFAIASMSEGSFRDGAKVFEELLLLSKDGKITRELIESIYHQQSNFLFVENLLQAIAQKNVKKGLEYISEAAADGMNIRDCIQQLIEKIHLLLLSKVGVSKSDEVEEISFSLEEMKQLLILLDTAYQEAKHTVIPQLPLELVVIEWGNPATSDSSGAELANENFLGSQRGPVSSSPSTTATPTDPNSSEFVPENFVSSPRSYPTPNSSSDTDIFWQKLIVGVNAENRTTAGLLRGCHVKSYDEKILVVGAKYSFHKEKLSEKSAFALLEKTCENITGKKIEIKIVSEGG